MGANRAPALGSQARGIVKAHTGTTPRIELTEIALEPREGMSMDEAKQKALALGYSVVRIEGRKLIVKEN